MDREKYNAYMREYSRGAKNRAYRMEYNRRPEVIDRLSQRDQSLDHRKRRYGLTQVELDQMIENQDRRCAICDVEFGSGFHIDHDHATGKVRGLLCQKCNMMLGMAGDSIDILISASKYLGRV